MRTTEVWKRPGGGKRVRESGALVQNPRVPKPAGLTRSARCTAMATGAPRPFHGIADVDRDGRREEEKAAVPDRNDLGSCVHRPRTKREKEPDKQDRSDSAE